MNDYEDLIEMLRHMSKAIIHEHAKLFDVPEENILDGDANAINDAADCIEQLLAENEKLKAALDAARNELCLLCGKYTDAHNGACDGCRWRGET